MSYGYWVQKAWKYWFLKVKRSFLNVLGVDGMRIEGGMWKCEAVMEGVGIVCQGLFKCQGLVLWYRIDQCYVLYITYHVYIYIYAVWCVRI